METRQDLYPMFARRLGFVRRVVFGVAGSSLIILLMLGGELDLVLPGLAICLVALAANETPNAHQQPWFLFTVDMMVATAASLIGFAPLSVLGILGWTVVISFSVRRSGKYLATTILATAVSAALGSGFAGPGLTIPVVLISTTLNYAFGRVFLSVGRSMRARERDLESLFQRVPVALYRTDALGNITEANQHLADLLGYATSRDLVAHSPNIWDGGDIADALQGLVESPEGRTELTHLMTRADGTAQAVRNTVVRVRDHTGAFMYLEGSVADGSELRAEQHHRQRLAAVVEATADLVSIARASDGTVAYANSAYLNWIASHVDLDGPFENQTALFGREMLERVKSGIRGAESWTGEMEVRGRTGVRYLHVVAQKHRTPDGLYISAVGRDLTPDRETAKRLEELVESKDEFIASVSHELRTPLAVVVGLAAELRDNETAFGAEERASLIEMVAEQSQEVGDIVEDLLVAARANTDSVVLAPEKVDIVTMISTTLRAFPRYMDLDVEVEGLALADPQRVKQILRNLVSNAIRYGGPDVKIRSFRDEYHLYLDVVDDGSGIHEQVAEEIFQPYTRAHEVGSQPGSVGLGLSVSRWLARKMGGDLTYHRERDHTIFRLQLPAADADLPPTVAMVPPPVLPLAANGDLPREADHPQPAESYRYISPV